MFARFFGFIFLSFAPLLQGEIQEIVLKWNAALCLDACIPGLTQQLQSISAVTELNINPRAGTAVMKWNPNAAFSYVPFNTATRMIGIRIEDFRMRVRGTIKHDSDHFFLISLGDNSQFELLGPIQPQLGDYTVRYNIASHPLSASLIQQFIDAEQNSLIVTIEGPLFEPLRYGQQLIVEQIRFPKKNDIDNRYKY